ncbi:MAG: hypothetical protein RIB43_02435 [Rhodospirillaceae bacterium]
MAEPQRERVTEIVGIFDRVEDLENAISQLMLHGFDRAQISLLADSTAVDEKMAHRYQRLEGLADNPDAPRAAYVSRQAMGEAEGAVISGLLYVGAITATGFVVASGGTLAATVAAAAAAGGFGSLIGTMLAMFLSDRHAAYLSDQLDRGGLLLWVAIRDEKQHETADSILREQGAHDVRAHTLPSARTNVKTFGEHEVALHVEGLYEVHGQFYEDLAAALNAVNVKHDKDVTFDQPSVVTGGGH